MPAAELRLGTMTGWTWGTRGPTPQPGLFHLFTEWLFPPSFFWQPFLTSPVATSCSGRRFHSWAGKGWFWGSQGPPEPGMASGMQPPAATTSCVVTSCPRCRMEGRYGHVDARAQGCMDVWPQVHGHRDGHTDCQIHGHRCVDARTPRCIVHMDAQIQGHIDA